MKIPIEQRIAGQHFNLRNDEAWAAVEFVACTFSTLLTPLTRLNVDMFAGCVFRGCSAPAFGITPEVTVVYHARLYPWGGRGGMGLVTDTRFVRCFWPRCERPTALFAAGSSGLQVQGPPTPRNVVFPEWTKFLDGTCGDCFFEVVHREHTHPVEEEVEEEALTKSGALVKARYTRTVEKLCCEQPGAVKGEPCPCAQNHCEHCVVEYDDATARIMAGA